MTRVLLALALAAPTFACVGGLAAGETAAGGAAAAGQAPGAGQGEVAPLPPGAATAVDAAGGGAAAPATVPLGTPENCDKSDFELAVDGAAAALRDLNQKNKPQFQDRLRQLKEKRGWTQDQFLKEAAPFAKDPQIDVYDRQSNELLNKISSMGEEGSAAPAPDCALLARLREDMGALIEAQNAKWAYIFQKIDAELAR